MSIDYNIIYPENLQQQPILTQPTEEPSSSIASLDPLLGSYSTTHSHNSSNNNINSNKERSSSYNQKYLNLIHVSLLELEDVESLYLQVEDRTDSTANFSIITDDTRERLFYATTSYGVGKSYDGVEIVIRNSQGIEIMSSYLSNTENVDEFKPSISCNFSLGNEIYGKFIGPKRSNPNMCHFKSLLGTQQNNFTFKTNNGQSLHSCTTSFSSFKILQGERGSAGGGGIVVGEIIANWPGENPNVFGITFTESIPVESKAILLLACIYLYVNYFETTCCRNICRIGAEKFAWFCTGEWF